MLRAVIILFAVISCFVCGITTKHRIFSRCVWRLQIERDSEDIQEDPDPALAITISIRGTSLCFKSSTRISASLSDVADSWQIMSLLPTALGKASSSSADIDVERIVAITVVFGRRSNVLVSPSPIPVFGNVSHVMWLRGKRGVNLDLRL